MFFFYPCHLAHIKYFDCRVHANSLNDISEYGCNLFSPQAWMFKCFWLHKYLELFEVGICLFAFFKLQRWGKYVCETEDVSFSNVYPTLGCGNKAVYHYGLDLMWMTASFHTDDDLIFWALCSTAPNRVWSLKSMRLQSCSDLSETRVAFVFWSCFTGSRSTLQSVSRTSFHSHSHRTMQSDPPSLCPAALSRVLKQQSFVT